MSHIVVPQRAVNVLSVAIERLRKIEEKCMEASARLHASAAVEILKQAQFVEPAHAALLLPAVQSMLVGSRDRDARSSAKPMGWDAVITLIQQCQRILREDCGATAAPVSETAVAVIVRGNTAELIEIPSTLSTGAAAGALRELATNAA